MSAPRNISYHPHIYFNVSYTSYPPQQKVHSLNRGVLSSSAQILNNTVNQPSGFDGGKNNNTSLKNVIPYFNTAIINLHNQALGSPNDKAIKNSAITLTREVINSPQNLTIFDYKNLLQAFVILKFKYSTHKELITEIIEKIFKIPPNSRLPLNEISRLLQQLQVDKEYIHNHVKAYLKLNFKKCNFNSINKLVMIDKKAISSIFTKNYPNHPFYKLCLNVISFYYLGFTRPDSDKYIDQIFSPLDPSHRAKPFIARSAFNQVAQAKNAYSQVFPQSVPDNSFKADASNMKELLGKTLNILIKMGYTSGTIQSQLNALIVTLTKDLNLTYQFEELVIFMELFVQLQAHEVPYCDEAIICLIKHSLPPQENQFEQVLNFLSCLSKITAGSRKSNFDGFLRQILNSLIKNPEDTYFCLNEKRIRPLLNLSLPIVLHALDLVQNHEDDPGITSFMTRLFTYWKTHFPYENRNKSSHELLQLGQVHALLSSYQLVNLTNSEHSKFILNTIFPSVENLCSAPQTLTISSKNWYETGLRVIAKILNNVLSLSEKLIDKTISREIIFKLLQLYGKYTLLKTTDSQIHSRTPKRKSNLLHSLHFISVIRSFIYIADSKEFDRLSINQVFEGLKNDIETFNVSFYENLPNQSAKEEPNNFKLDTFYLTGLEFITLMNFLEREESMEDAKLAEYRIKFLLVTNLSSADSFYPLLNQFNKIFNSPFSENSIKKNLIEDSFQKLNNQLLSSTISDDLVLVEYIDCLFQHNQFFEILSTSSSLSFDFLKKQLIDRYSDKTEVLAPSMEEDLSPQEVKSKKNDSKLNRYDLSSFEFITLMSMLETAGSVDDERVAAYRVKFLLLTDFSKTYSFYSLLNQFNKIFNSPFFKDSLKKGLVEDKLEELTSRLASVSMYKEIVLAEYIDCLFQYNQFSDLSSENSFVFIDFLKKQLTGNLMNLTDSHLAKLIILLSCQPFDLQEDQLLNLFAASPISNPYENYENVDLEFNSRFENSTLIEYLRIFPSRLRVNRDRPYRNFSKVPDKLFQAFLDACKKLNIPSFYLPGGSAAVQNSSLT